MASNVHSLLNHPAESDMERAEEGEVEERKRQRLL
jgi:hypothetical protein